MRSLLRNYFAVDLYNAGGRERQASIAPDVVPLHLANDEKAALIAFLVQSRRSASDS